MSGWPSSPTLNVVLVHPAIPQNTGNISRLTAANYAHLHLIEPMAFEIDEKRVRRAGLDYWPEVRLTQHANWQAFLEASGARSDQLWFLSTKGGVSYFSVTFKHGDYLVFGSESSGLPQWYHDTYPDRRLVIPMDNPNIRSLNLSNAASAVLYEAKRQIALPNG